MRSYVSWLMPGLILLGFALFQFTRASQSAPAFAMSAVHVVQGTVATSDTKRTSVGAGNRATTRVDYVLTLTGRPQNVTFRLDTTPAGGVAAGAGVRLEILEDPEEAFTSGARHPDSGNQIHAVGATVNGTNVYSAAEYVSRSEAAAGSARTYAIVCLLLGLAWAGVVGYVAVRRGAFRDLIPEDWRS
ncbi:hypothetical protein [Nonomuraea typhae]|uniref:hypothetical protein n=1 Tax=Nonomuraea typhae TaxID=2603600 RepID=UPI0012F9AD60|nr:hypothetical protein [Nonomuraea typhae]